MPMDAAATSTYPHRCQIVLLLVASDPNLTQHVGKKNKPKVLGLKQQ